MISAVYGEDSVNDWMCKMVGFWNFLRNDVPWFGRPLEADSNQVKVYVTGDCQHFENIQIKCSKTF